MRSSQGTKVRHCLYRKQMKTDHQTDPNHSSQVTDTLTPKERSARMRLVRSQNTRPEMTVRRLLHGMGYRYRLHDRRMPGSPDLVFGARRKVIFVHGCFWHSHPRCRFARLPKSRLSYWIPKLEANRARDKRNARALRKRGWRVLVVWECELPRQAALARQIAKFLGPPRFRRT